MSRRGVVCHVLTGMLVLTGPAAAGQDANRWRHTAPETFRANAQITGGPGGVASALTARVERYTSDADHAAMVATLTSGGQTALVEALKKAPAVGEVKIGGRTIAIRWARERASGQTRRVIIVTDAPLFFFGAGAVDARPTDGYDIAVLEFTIDSIGYGQGTMAAAAKVKPGGPAGVEVEDYSGKRVTLMTVTRESS